MPTRQAKEKKTVEQPKEVQPPFFSPRVVGMLADEVTKTMMHRLPHLFPTPTKRGKKAAKKIKKLEHALILDTSAIIDRRILEVMHIGLLVGDIIIPEGVLLELKHIADSQDTVKRERGRKGLEELDRLKKVKSIKVNVLPHEMRDNKPLPEVDEQLIHVAKHYKGRVITCDYNLEKKASIQGVSAINVNALANALKVTAVPGEAVHIKVLHLGKEPTQGVGYLDDGTMIVVEHGDGSIGKTIDVVISRVIQTATGRILFAKKI
ncbi:MAG: TRAM domain-containing protein [Candidatus Levybacteria bacterium]|nr:TRAM domain-containing protein [Candidatus Levybacteria bacterium]